jgi:hypothetical protein
MPIIDVGVILPPYNKPSERYFLPLWFVVLKPLLSSKGRMQVKGLFYGSRIQFDKFVPKWYYIFIRALFGASLFICP